MLKLRPINNCKVEPVNVKRYIDRDKKPIKGYNLLPEIYCNVFALAKKKSGKSTLFYKMIRESVDPRTKVYAFVSTLNKDPIWKSIRDWCDTHNVEFNGFTSIMDDDGRNILNDLITSLGQENEEMDEQPKIRNILDDEEEKPQRKRKYKYRVPEYLIVLDDLSNELSNPSISALLKKNRHYKMKVLIGNQYWNDLSKSGRKQIDYMILFGSQPKDKLLEVHKELDLHTPFDEFYEIYKIATKDRFNFLYIDCVNEKFRKNFNIEFQIDPK